MVFFHSKGHRKLLFFQPMHFHLYCVFYPVFIHSLFHGKEKKKKSGNYFETIHHVILKVRKTPCLALFKGKMITGMTPKNFWSL